MVDELRRRPRTLAVILLVVVCAAWGSTFVVVKGAVTHLAVLDFLAWRFMLAAGLLIALRPRALVRLGRRGWARGIALGLTLALGYILQTFGLRLTTAAVSGFITGLQVVFTPLLVWLLLRRRPTPRTAVAIAMATAGLAVISLRTVAVGAGEVLTLLSAVAFALQIVATGKWASTEDAYGLASVQLLTVAAVSAVGAAPSGLSVPRSTSVWAAIVLTAVVATAFAFAVQTWAQSHLSATSTSVIFTFEPAFAALFAWVAGEAISPAVAVGGALVVGSMLVLGLAPGTGRRRTVSADPPPAPEALQLRVEPALDSRPAAGVPSAHPSGAGAS